MLESEGVADLVQCHLAIPAAVFVGTPVDQRVHDRDLPLLAGKTGDGRRRSERVQGTDVAGHDLEAETAVLDESQAGVAAEEIEDLPDPLLLRLADGVDQRVALAIDAVHGGEVVVANERARVRTGRPCGQSMLVAVGRNEGLPAVTRLVDRAELRRKLERTGGRGERAPVCLRRIGVSRSADRSIDLFAGGVEDAEIAGGHEARIVV